MKSAPVESGFESSKIWLFAALDVWLVIFVSEPRAEELKRLRGLELRHHMARTADRQEVKTLLLVAGDVASHAQTAVHRPRPPWLRGFEACASGRHPLRAAHACKPYCSRID
eukprot:6205718-Pleurochrysis_carterae.AAC.3